MRPSRLLFAAAAFAVADDCPASARAFAGVRQAIVDFSISPMNDPGVFAAIGVSLSGGLPVSNVSGQGVAAGGCAPTRFGINCTLSGTVGAAAGQYSRLDSILSGEFLVKNTSATSLGLVNWSLDFSAFNPGGAEIGASVTDPTTEFASFSSSAVTDAHACDTRAPTLQSRIPLGAPGVACGVMAPNDEQVFRYTAPLAAGATVAIPFAITIAAVAASGVPGPTGIPEPMGMGLLLGPILLAAGRRT